MSKTLSICILILVNSLCLGGDWPSFLGPNADGISTEKGINKTWSNTPPKELWRIPMSDKGYSGPAVVGDVLYILDHEGEQDVVRALNFTNGQELWRFEYAEEGDEDHGFSRATPTVQNDTLYTVSRTGVVHCLKTSDGTMVWRTDAMTGKPPTWGAAHSALIHGDHLITLGVGENAHVVALNKHTGETVWTGGGTEMAGYATHS